jgi:hypothetical protein
MSGRTPTPPLCSEAPRPADEMTAKCLRGTVSWQPPLRRIEILPDALARLSQDWSRLVPKRGVNIDPDTICD